MALTVALTDTAVVVGVVMALDRAVESWMWRTTGKWT